jgi:hypothetical protein
VQYHGRTLQLIPDSDRRSYARTYVELQERLDGKILVYCRGKLLTPGEAPPLATTLRNISSEETKALVTPFADPSESEMELPEPQSKVMWYADPEMKVLHSNLIKAGMERARHCGKRIGRSQVSQRPDFNQKLEEVLERINLGILSRRQGAKELDIGCATLKRLMDAHCYTQERSEGDQSLPATAENHCNEYIEVLN